MQNVNVSIWVPGNTVSSMQDEIADGSVEAAVKAARKAYLPLDSDGNVPVVKYTEDFDNAVEEALNEAAKTPGRDLLVIVTDLECNEPERAERLLEGLTAEDDFVVIVPVSNQGYNKAWATKLDDNHAAADHIDVVSVADLANPTVANDEVGPWANKA